MSRRSTIAALGSILLILAASARSATAQESPGDRNRRGNRVHGRFGLMVGPTRLAGGIEGLSTGRSVHLDPEYGLGGSLRVGLAWVRRPSGRVSVLLDGRLETIGAGRCGADGWFPFCGSQQIASLEAGIAIRR